jgi:hypothetical protein
MSESTPQALIPDVRTRVRLVYSHPDPKTQGWPYQGYDYEGRKKELTTLLRQTCPKVEFLPAMARTDQDAAKLLESDPSVDGYLVYLLGIPSNAARTLAMSNRPVVLVDDLYGGTGQFLGVYGEACRKGMRVAGVSSTRFDDVAKAVQALEVMKRLSCSTILDVTERQLGDQPRIFEESMGVKIRQVAARELNAAYDSADRAEAKRWAETWIGRAGRMVEPSPADVEKGGAMYLAMRSLLASNKAQGIAVDCLNLFYGGKMFAYPCMGFFQLNNDGLVGACEADIHSAATMLLITYLTGRPGYISDPVIDTSKNQVIYAHCVAPNKVFGPAGPENPYDIRSHSEDRKGAAIRSLLPLGETTTTLRFIPQEKTVVFHQAKAVANIDEDRACRTKLAAEPKDARKLAKDWAFGWHRVTVYGDYRGELETITSLMGFRLTEEG